MNMARPSVDHGTTTAVPISNKRSRLIKIAIDNQELCRRLQLGDEARPRRVVTPRWRLERRETGAFFFFFFENLETGARWDDEQRRDSGGGGGLTRSSRKRPYEYSEHEVDVMAHKLYKWGGPSLRQKIEFLGLGLVPKPDGSERPK